MSEARTRACCVAVLAFALACLHSSFASDVLSSGEHSANINGVQIWYRVTGHGPVLVVQAPGWGIGSTYLQRTLTPLERSLTVIYFDTRGSGHSSRPADPAQMSTLNMADDLESLRQYLGLTVIAVFGHSHGGEIAAVFAAKYPEHVSRLILVDSVPPKNPDPESDAKSNAIYGRLSKDPHLTDAIKAVRESGLPDTSAGVSSVIQRMTPLYWHDASKASALANLPPIDAWAGTALAKADSRLKFDLLPELKHLTAPVLIVQGKDDYIVPVFMQESFEKNIPHSRLVVFDQSGHFPWIEEPGKFFAAITNFLQQR